MNEESRRSHYRWELSAPCLCTGKNFRTKGEVVELSLDGARISRADSLPAKQASLEIMIRTDRGDVNLHAYVVWTEEEQNAFGVRFLSSNEEKREKLLPLFP